MQQAHGAVDHASIAPSSVKQEQPHELIHELPRLVHDHPVNSVEALSALNHRDVRRLHGMQLQLVRHLVRTCELRQQLAVLCLGLLSHVSTQYYAQHSKPGCKM
jgi:hypothetical protein